MNYEWKFLKDMFTTLKTTYTRRFKILIERDKINKINKKKFWLLNKNTLKFDEMKTRCEVLPESRIRYEYAKYSKRKCYASSSLPGIYPSPSPIGRLLVCRLFDYLLRLYFRSATIGMNSPSSSLYEDSRSFAFWLRTICLWRWGAAEAQINAWIRWSLSSFLRCSCCNPWQYTTREAWNDKTNLQRKVPNAGLETETKRYHPASHSPRPPHNLAVWMTTPSSLQAIWVAICCRVSRVTAWRCKSMQEILSSW